MSEKPGILIVDHEKGELERLIDLLSNKFPDYQIYPSDNGKEALNVIREHKIDVILSNLVMPKLGGLQLARIVNKEYPGIPVVIMFESKDADIARDVIEEGVSAYIKKPIESIDSVTQSIEVAIEKGASYSLINREMMRLLLEALPESLIVIDKTKEVKFVNPPGMQLLRNEGLTDGEPAYEEIKKLLQIDPFALAKKHPPVKDMELSQVLYRLTVLPIHPDGSDRFGYLLILRDLSVRSRTEQLQRNFLTLVSHEFRAPLTILESGLQLLDMEKLSKEKRGKLIEGSRAQIHRITRLVDNIIDLSRIETNRLVLKPEKVDVKRFFKRLVEFFQVAIDREERDIRVKCAPTICEFMVADPDRLQQVFFNLIDNAIKFSPKGSPIVIRVDGGPGEFIVDVIDQGPGIPLEQQEKIFRPFVQAEATLTHRVVGSG